MADTPSAGEKGFVRSAPLMKGAASIAFRCLMRRCLRAGKGAENGSGLIFRRPRRPAGRSYMALTNVLRDHGLADRGTVHSVRSTFRDWWAETGKLREIAEAMLGHTVGGVEGACFRSDLDARQTRAHGPAGAFLTGVEATVGSLVREENLLQRWTIALRLLGHGSVSSHGPARSRPG